MRVTNSSARFLFDILELLGFADQPMTLTAIRQALDLPASTAHRGLATLEQTGFAERYQASTRYRLGPNARLLRQTFFVRFEARDRVLPFLRRLSSATGETTSFSIRISWFTVRIAVVVGTHGMLYARPIGEVRRLDDSLAGRVILAALPPTELARFKQYARAGNQPPAGSATDKNMVTRVLMDSDHRPAAVVAIEGPVMVETCGAARRVTEWWDILDQLADALTPVEHHYSHLQLESPDLLRMLHAAWQRARLPQG
jgi:DNA-binding IclR family transcriptional regulator